MKVRLNNARGTFLYFNAPQAPSADILRNNPKAEAKYTGTFILDDESTAVILPGAGQPAVPTTMDKVLEAVAVEAWKDKAKVFLAALERNRKCYRDGDGQLNRSGEPYEGFGGNMFVVAKNKDQPKFYAGSKTEITNPSDIGRLFYWGARFNVVIDVYATSKGSKGIFAGLQIVQFNKDGEPLGGSANATSDDLVEVDNSSDPLG